MVLNIYSTASHHSRETDHTISTTQVHRPHDGNRSCPTYRRRPLLRLCRETPRKLSLHCGANTLDLASDGGHTGLVLARRSSTTATSDACSPRTFWRIVLVRRQTRAPRTRSSTRAMAFRSWASSATETTLLLVTIVLRCGRRLRRRGEGWEGRQMQCIGKQRTDARNMKTLVESLYEIWRVQGYLEPDDYQKYTRYLRC